MRYLFPGLLLGFVINLCLLTTSGSLEIYPLFSADLAAEVELTRVSPLVKDEKIQYPLRRGGRLDFIAPSGRIISSVTLEGENVALAGNGRYYTSFGKTGREVEFRGAGGERYWKIKSLEYPYVSTDGRQVLLLNGDHSGLRTVDFNGNVTGTVSGRLCTTISFQGEGDNSAVGFMDGTYYVINEAGVPVITGATPGGRTVKGIGMSNNGMFACVHYGDVDGDFLRIADREKGRSVDIPLGSVHVTRTSMHAGDDGNVLFLDANRVLCVDKEGKTLFSMNIPAKKPGHSAIGFHAPLYVVAYSDDSGRSRAYFIHMDGTLLYGREYPAETFLDSRVMGEYVFLRGSGHLYAYRYRF